MSVALTGPESPLVRHHPITDTSTQVPTGSQSCKILCLQRCGGYLFRSVDIIVSFFIYLQCRVLAALKYFAKVFSLILTENLDNFHDNRVAYTLRTSVDYVGIGELLLICTPYLACVEYGRLFVVALSRTFGQINEIGSTLSFMFFRLWGAPGWYIMRQFLFPDSLLLSGASYVSPVLDLIELSPLSGFVCEVSGGGSEGIGEGGEIPGA